MTSVQAKPSPNPPPYVPIPADEDDATHPLSVLDIIDPTDERTEPVSIPDETEEDGTGDDVGSVAMGAAPSAPIAQDNTSWLLLIDESAFGPLRPEDMGELVSDGKIDDRTPVWDKKARTWREVGCVGPLASALREASWSAQSGGEREAETTDPDALDEEPIQVKPVPWPRARPVSPRYGTPPPCPSSRVHTPRVTPQASVAGAYVPRMKTQRAVTVRQHPFMRPSCPGVVNGAASAGLELFEEMQDRFMEPPPWLWAIPGGIVVLWALLALAL